jgi:hypothetical protein
VYSTPNYLIIFKEVLKMLESLLEALDTLFEKIGLTIANFLYSLLGFDLLDYLEGKMLKYLPFSCYL